MRKALWNRRTTLGFGAAAIGLACVGGIMRIVDDDGRRLPGDEAYAPWRSWDDASLRGTPLALVAAACLAANPHDTQPWLFRLADDAIEIFADASRHLGAMDPFLREMHIGLGAAIENLTVAAGPNGFAAAVEMAPGALTSIAERRRPQLAAVVRLTRRTPTAPDRLYEAIPRRHTNRYAYRPDVSPPAQWTDFAVKTGEAEGVRAFLFSKGAPRAKFDAAVLKATQAVIADATMIADSDRWFRGSDAEIAAHRDGPNLRTAGLSTFTFAYARLFPVSPETSHNAWLSATRDVQLATAPLTGLLAVPDRYDRPGAIAVGRIWQRLHLIATPLGLALQPINQPVERIDRERELGEPPLAAARMTELTGEAWQATFAFRAGYAVSEAPPSPRRPLKDIVVEG